MAEPIKKENRIYTYADYAAWPDDKPYEVIAGDDKIKVGIFNDELEIDMNVIFPE